MSSDAVLRGAGDWGKSYTVGNNNGGIFSRYRIKKCDGDGGGSATRAREVQRQQRRKQALHRLVARGGAIETGRKQLRRCLRRAMTDNEAYVGAGRRVKQQPQVHANKQALSVSSIGSRGRGRDFGGSGRQRQVLPPNESDKGAVVYPAHRPRLRKMGENPESWATSAADVVQVVTCRGDDNGTDGGVTMTEGSTEGTAAIQYIAGDAVVIENATDQSKCEAITVVAFKEDDGVLDVSSEESESVSGGDTSDEGGTDAINTAATVNAMEVVGNKDAQRGAMNPAGSRYNQKFKTDDFTTAPQTFSQDCYDNERDYASTVEPCTAGCSPSAVSLMTVLLYGKISPKRSVCCFEKGADDRTPA